MAPVKAMFEGIDQIPDKLRFSRLYRACRLQPVARTPFEVQTHFSRYLLLEGSLSPTFLFLPPRIPCPGQDLHGKRPSFVELFTAYANDMQHRLESIEKAENTMQKIIKELSAQRKGSEHQPVSLDQIDDKIKREFNETSRKLICHH